MKGKTPKEVDKIKVVDPTCGSGSFLIVAYQVKLEKTMFLILGILYENKPPEDIEDCLKFIPEEYKGFFGDAVNSLQ